MPGPLRLPSIRSKVFLSHYAAYKGRLISAGHQQGSLRLNLKHIAHFGFWLELEGRTISEVDGSVLQDFDRHCPRCRCPGVTRDRRCVLSSLRGFLRYLQGDEAIRWRPPPRAHPSLVKEFLEWMKLHRGAVKKTLVCYGHYATDFVEVLGIDPSSYTAQGIRQFITERSRNLRVGSAQQVINVVRMFLRYLATEGLCRPELIGAMPSMARWSFRPLPLGLSDDEVEVVLSACSASPIGHRDRAMILLMVRLGLRAGDVGMLRFVDLAFGDGRLRVQGKSGRTTWLPLPQDVGDAVLRYVREGRPRVPNEYVFLRSKAPHEPLAITSNSPGAAISGRARVALERANIRRRPGGSHVFRHTAACQMLRRGVRLEDIAEILRHRSVSTAAIYAKVDQDLLLTVAQAWPEVQ